MNVLFIPNKLQSWLLILLGGLAVLASYWILEIIQSQDKNSAQVLRVRPDYYVENFNFVKILPNGQNKYRVVGTKLVHYSNDDHADVTLPVITNLDPAQPPMRVRSERGVIKNIAEQAENEIHLYENVVVNRPKTDKFDHLQLSTNYLLALPNKNTMETDFPVEIISGDTVTTGIGMKVNNATQEMQILNNVHSIIPPYLEQKKTQ